MKKALLAALLMTLVLLDTGAVLAQDEVEFTREHGYIEMGDGVRLKYTVLLPPGEGPWPVVLQYEGYNAGSYPDRLFEDYKHELLGDGYAMMGLSVRGTACSSGVFDIFNPVWGRDGAEAIEWAATQPWSNGKIGMFSLSFAGIMQLMTAIEQPPHLVSIAPGQVVSDVYRDVGYPGGMANIGFPPLFVAALQAEWAEAIDQAVADGDAECLANEATHPALNLSDNLAVNGLLHPTDDDWHALRSTDERLHRIKVPVLGMQSWQDEQTGPRGGYHFDALNPETTWIVSANGPHGLYNQSPRFLSLLHSWFDFTLKGIDNGFAERPRVEIWHEVSLETKNPAWVSTDERWPLERTPLTLHLREDDLLTTQPAGSDEGGASYAYPLAGPPGGFEPVIMGGWSNTPVQPSGSVAFTTGALPEDLTFAGEASADLWISATAPDVGLQVTITEVRPDGQEVYVQRGWLQASHRAVDEDRSTVLRPVHPHTEASLKDLPLAEPVLARVEILPFGHTFRAGSAIRMWIDTPSLTGFWDFLIPATPAQITVHHDAAHPSQLVLGYLDAGPAPVPLPACGSLDGQACRADSIGIPAITGPSAPIGESGDDVGGDDPDGNFGATGSNGNSDVDDSGGGCTMTRAGGGIELGLLLLAGLVGLLIRSKTELGSE